jgi:hypothetical protein
MPGKQSRQHESSTVHSGETQNNIPLSILYSVLATLDEMEESVDNLKLPLRDGMPEPDGGRL